MKRLLLFAGASEGRLLAEMLAGEPVEITACTATNMAGSCCLQGRNAGCGPGG